jgi:ATP-dependent HslUV protease ATP-binding subunit HslU
VGDVTPKDIVRELDQYIVGQQAAKKVLAISLSNRERRRRLPEELRREILPKNVLMIGSTGVGKTEMARRLAAMMQASFLKVEATKFTEVGYVGRDVESIVHDLVEVSTSKVYHDELEAIESKAEGLATERIIGYLCQQLGEKKGKRATGKGRQAVGGVAKVAEQSPGRVGAGSGRGMNRRSVSRLLRDHQLEEQVIEIEVGGDIEVADAFVEPRLEVDLDDDGLFEECYRSVRNQVGQRKRKVPVREARRILTRDEANKLLDLDDVVERATKSVQENAVVFIDEIDKLCGPKMDMGRDISGEGVQRDLLPLLEGSTVVTRYGPIRTEHILFVAAGTFSQNKPSDLIPELQGRFPLRVEFDSLNQRDLERVLVEPRNSLIAQYQALLATEGVDLEFTEDGIQEIARYALLMNERTENIGARRLFTVVERLLEDLSFTASERRGEKVVVDAIYVGQQVGGLIKDENLSRYIL